MSGLILASGSKIRRQLLAGAGLSFEVEVSHVDEDAVKASARDQEGTALSIAETLAELKALQVSARYPGSLVIGCDQTLDCQGILFDKPKDRDQAFAHLMAFSGKTHSLISSVVVVKDNQRLWHHNERADLQVRPLSQDYIAWYLEQVGDAATSSVGAYQLEGLGAQLFSKISGDYFTILGLPLLPLLEFLRGQGVLNS